MRQYKFWNRILGWGVFLIAAVVYLATAEPTASWWDCGEYIATAGKLEVGHPPGAPTFQLLGRVFSFFAAGNVYKTAYMVNAMSAIAGALTILFLFWTITMLAKKLANDPNNLTTNEILTVLASGVIGSLAYTFSDTFWFSAVEGEVYATSSFITALTFWIALKWEEQAEDAHNLKWLLLTSFIIGLSIGVHLLNLLVIPAMVYIYYFKRNPKITTKGMIFSGIISVIIIAVVLFLIIPYVVSLAGSFEVFFINSIGLPFNAGTIIYFLLLFGFLAWAVIYTQKKNKPVWNSLALSFTFLLIGYSTFLILVIRANANTPINENEPKDATALLTYLNREQYGSIPTLYGPYYNARRVGIKEKSPKYVKDTASGKYVAVPSNPEPEWNDKHCTVFPRMYSMDPSRPHELFYKYWAGIRTDKIPSFGENLKFFFRYQIHHMYWRYFMWNFVGRQNDIQSYGLNHDNQFSSSNGTKDLLKGNWITGIGFIDQMRLGPQNNMPSIMKENRGRNTLFGLPLILGLVGLIFHIKRRGKDAFVVFLLFFMTGLAIAIYLNMPPNQPRERDYAFAGSFYAFAIWIGIGVTGLSSWLKRVKQIPERVNIIAVSVVTFFAVPFLMACQEWDDHDRSGKYAARDFANNYMDSCDENAILFSFGDNDTFPLWYVQEIEGKRPDIRILNYTLSGMHWYVEQLYNKVNESHPIPFTLPKTYYKIGADWSVILPKRTQEEDLVSLLQRFSTDPTTTEWLTTGDSIKVLQNNKVYITFNKAKMAAKGLYPKEMVDDQEGKISWTIPTDRNGQKQISRNELMFLDILASTHFERPIYMINPYYFRNIFPDIDRYVRQEGILYRLMPYPVNQRQEIEKSYRLMMETFQWGNLNDPSVYLESAVSVPNGKGMRQNYMLLARALNAMGERDKAVAALNKGLEYFTPEQLPFDKYDINYADEYLRSGDPDKKGTEILEAMALSEMEMYNYLSQFSGKKQRCISANLEETTIVLYQILAVAEQYDVKSKILDQVRKIPAIEAIFIQQNMQKSYQNIATQLNAASSMLKGENKTKAIQVLDSLVGVIAGDLVRLQNTGEAAQGPENYMQEMLMFVYQQAQLHNLPDLQERIIAIPGFSHAYQQKIQQQIATSQQRNNPLNAAVPSIFQ